jgi:hypothetical protein
VGSVVAGGGFRGTRDAPLAGLCGLRSDKALVSALAAGGVTDDEAA